MIVKLAVGIRRMLLRLELKESKGSLGIFVSMDGKSKDQIEHLKKTRQMAQYSRTLKVGKNDAWYTFTVAFLKKLNIQWKPPG